MQHEAAKIGVTQRPAALAARPCCGHGVATHTLPACKLDLLAQFLARIPLERQQSRRDRPESTRQGGEVSIPL